MNDNTNHTSGFQILLKVQEKTFCFISRIKGALRTISFISLIRHNVRLILVSLVVLGSGREGGRFFFFYGIKFASSGHARESTLSALHTFVSSGLQRFERKSMKKPEQRAKKKENDKC